MTDSTLPLGKKSGYPHQYTPALLFAIARDDSRKAFGAGAMPFHGTDIWNAWELTWLGPGDLPVAATAEIRISAATPNLIESKSLKLYLNSFAMSRYDTPAAVADTMTTDLSASVKGSVEIRVTQVTNADSATVSRLPGLCLDNLAVSCSAWEVDASLLRADPDTKIEEELHTHLLRSLCPVTAQPDIGSFAIHYHGPRIDHASLLQYVVSFREHSDFHEACIERMFVDVLSRCNPEKLSIYARYQRRGGIDINPFRSNFEDPPGNLRLWRQ